MPSPIWTRNNDNERSGAYNEEERLTAAHVAANGVSVIRKLRTHDARGCEASPLFWPGLKFPGGKTRDVVFLCDMTNHVMAYDIDTGEALWDVQIGRPIAGTKRIDGFLINSNWGILSTPVIDGASQTLIGCAWISSDGTWSNGQHVVFRLELTTGKAVAPSINLAGVTYGYAMATVHFNTAERKQRAALLLENGIVYVAFGSIFESLHTNRGWIIAIDLAKWTVGAAWSSTVHGFGGGIWQGGAGLAADSKGRIIVMTGNGTFDALTDFGESVVALEYSAGHLDPVANWTPWTDDARVGLDPRGIDYDTPTPTNVRQYTKLEGEGWGDMDLGSAGPLVIGGLDLVIACGKDGIVYGVRLSNFGNTKPADLGNPSSNYAKLAFPPLWGTYYNAEVSPAVSDPSQFNSLFYGVTHHLHGAPVHLRDSSSGDLVFMHGENGVLRAWWASAKDFRYLAAASDIASSQAHVPPGGMPGGMLAVSSNGGTHGTGVVWDNIPYLDANMQISPGRLVAYDASQFENGSIRKLWDSQDWGWEFSHNKFGVPVIANGRVLMPTFDGEIWVLE